VADSLYWPYYQPCYSSLLFANVIKLEELESYDEQEQSKELGDEDEKKKQFRLLGPLGQGHNIVVHIRSSSIYTARFKELVGRMIPMDNRTRWNSWYNMLIVLLNLRPAVEKYCEDYEEELEEDILNHLDWKKLRTTAIDSGVMSKLQSASGLAPWDKNHRVRSLSSIAYL
jgi:hypothetical protein